MKLRVTQTILWLLAGLGFGILIMRLLNGPGSVTALTDIIPWGLWKGGGVVALVALGGAGFTLAMFVYIFGWERYRPLVRGAVLFALMAYSSVGFGLTVDIGIWWRIVFPVVHWQYHSVLFEVAWCIMLYLGVLLLEFSHTAFERFRWERALRVLHKGTIVFVIAGISLSTLHQSSLGTLFLATPFRLHPLWHTDFLPLLFFVSAMAVGCLTISLVALIVHWLHDAEPPMDAIAGLGRIATYLMGAYLVLRFADIFANGKGALLLRADLDTLNFWVETVLSAALPLALLLRRSFRNSPHAMFWIALCASVGFTLNRVNVAGLATLSLTDSVYWPSWTEWALSFGVLSAAALIYLYVADRFALFGGVGEQAKDRPPQRQAMGERALFMGSQRHAEPRLYSLVFILAIALSVGCASDDALFGVQPDRVAVSRPRVVRAVEEARGDGTGMRLAIPTAGGSPAAREVMALLIDGNHDGRHVLFDHDGHMARTADGPADCGHCHHMNKPLDDATSCAECHTDMYGSVDIFHHELHASALGGNDGCIECHADPELPKVRQNTTPCAQCHQEMRVSGSRILPNAEPSGTSAVAYVDAMHDLCIDCHQEEDERRPPSARRLSECLTCHAVQPRSDADVVRDGMRRPQPAKGRR